MSEYRKTIENLIRDILGDFPQGFNAGVVAGVPGWAGDMAYLAQEYPRALLTDTPLRPPVEYAGTTDSIAKAAGYEIPGTFSGQLGAAVGGLLSPGPGDLAKFAPLGAMFLGTKANKGLLLPSDAPLEEWQTDAIAAGKSAPVVSQGYWHPVFAGKKGSSPVDEIEFSRTPSGVSMTPKATVSPEQLLGSALIPAYGDRTAAGLNLNSVNGVEFGEPVMLEGGPDFMRTHDAHGSAWASGKGVISALHNRMLTAAEGGRDVYMPYITMGHGASDFNTMLADTLLEQLRYGKYTKKSKKEFDDEMRKIRPDWLGIDHPGAISQLEGNGEIRRTFVDRMSLDKFVNAGFPDIGASRRAITEDSLLSVPNDMAGYSIAKLDTTAPKILEPKAPHKTYANQLAGNYFGGFEQPVPRDVMFSDWYRARRAEGKPTSADHRSFDLAKPIQIADQQWLDGVMEYLINRLDR